MTRNSIVVEPLALDAQGVPVLPTSAKAPDNQNTDPLAALVVPKDFEGIDDTYKGKTVKDIIDMHKNATRKIGEQGQEINVWRELVAKGNYAGNGAVTNQAEPKTPEPEGPISVTADELLTDPATAISRVVERSLSKALGPLEENFKRQSAAEAQRQLINDFPEMGELGNDEGFVAWAVGATSRREDALAAQQGDTKAARRLMEQWRDRETLIQSLKAPSGAGQGNPAPKPASSGKPQGIEGARQATTERGSAGGPGPQATLTSEEIVNTIINNPDVYRSSAYQEKIMQAAKAGTLKMNQPAAFTSR